MKLSEFIRKKSEIKLIGQSVANINEEGERRKNQKNGRKSLTNRSQKTPFLIVFL